MSRDDTIFAIASGFGRTGIAVVRLSGRGAGASLAALLHGPLPLPRRASLRRLRDETGAILDQALVLWLPGPGSFTGEDQAELHIHGGLAVRAAVLGALGRMSECRAAEPGEFTRRAFLNGRLDLSEVEGLADLIDAETEAQRRQALRQFGGALAMRIEGWRSHLIEAAASLEAGLDFTDEDDVPSDVAEHASGLMSAVAAEIRSVLADGTRGERLRDGFTVVIAGPPNSGKSTLLNALARREVAIVSSIPGTTRDAIEVRCDLGGLPVTFVDTAGLRDTVDPIEHAGIARTRSHLAEADLVLWLQETGWRVPPPSFGAALRGVSTKADLASGEVDADVLAISAATGFGLDRLIALVEGEAAATLVGGGDALITRERHRIALSDVIAALERAGGVVGTGHDELAAEDLRLALTALGRITGRVDVDEVLDRIFGQFCIGK